jgi:hypothetical protein
MFIRQEAQLSDVPTEFIKSAFAHLEAAERLNAEIVNGSWAGNYQRGQVVMWLTFHATELFLKGFISKVAPTSKIKGHTLPRLKEQLESTAGAIDFQLPFLGEAPDGFENLIQEYVQTVHERFRYPTDQSGLPWSGVAGFSAQLFTRTLKKLRADAEAAHVRLFAG